MKKLLFVAVVGLLGMTSCATETVCTLDLTDTTYTVYDTKVKTCVGTTCATTDIVGNRAAYITSLEVLGADCK